MYLDFPANFPGLSHQELHPLQPIFQEYPIMIHEPQPLFQSPYQEPHSLLSHLTGAPPTFAFFYENLCSKA